jgi:Glycosyl hydrolase family 26
MTWAPDSPSPHVGGTRRALLILSILVVPALVVATLIGKGASTSSSHAAGASMSSSQAAGATSPPSANPASGTALRNRSVTGSHANQRIYWGAYMNGDDTFGHMYGGAWGDAPWDERTWSTFEADARKKVSILHWAMNHPPWETDFDAWKQTFERVRTAGATNAVDMSTGAVPLREIADGHYDSAIATWMRQAAAWQHPFFVILDPEMNGTWKAYAMGKRGNTPADFVRMWRRVHGIAVREGATNITWVWTVNVDPTNGFVPYEQLYPGDAYVDWTGLNGFNADGYASFSWLFSTSYASLLQLAPTKPIAITETGSVEGGIGKPAWITDVLAHQLPENFPQIRALLWFNWRIHDGGKWRDWPIESSSAAQRAFARAIASPYYAARGTYDLPLLRKIAPPE